MNLIRNQDQEIALRAPGIRVCLDARGATQVLDRGEQAVDCGAARCLLHILGRSAKTDSCGRSFAVVSTQVSAVGLRLVG